MVPRAFERADKDSTASVDFTQLGPSLTESRQFQRKDLTVHQLLNPTLDVVFKLLFIRYQHLLRDMIEAVLGLTMPLQSAEVLNPEVPREYPADKTIVLDVRVRLGDGRLVDLEMQSTNPLGTRVRFLYYWAKTFADGLSSGDDYKKLRDCISVLWFREPILAGDRFHSIFRLSEIHDHEVFSPEIEFHVLELPKLDWATGGNQARLERWARFFRARTVEELEDLAREDSVMDVAKNALEELSADEDARRLAREREMALVTHHHLLGASFEAGEIRGHEKGLVEGRAEGLVEGRAEGLVEGRAEGRVEGRAEGRVEGHAEGRVEGHEKGLAEGLAKGVENGLRVAIETACSLLGIELDEERLAKLSQLDAEGLEHVLARLSRERRWPEDIE